MLPSRRFGTATSLAMVVMLAVGATPAGGTEGVLGPELRFYNWAGYVDPRVLDDFEAEFGITVTVETFDDENAMVSVIQADTSRFDLFVTSDAVLFEMAEQRLVAELDLANIPNLANVDPLYLDLPSDPGNRFSVPYDWGTTGIAFNVDCIQPDDPSWGLLLDPRIAGRVAMNTDFSVALGSILKYLGYPLNSRPFDRELRALWNTARAELIASTG